MGKPVRIQFLDKRVYMTPAKNLIAKSSILSAFLLPADAIVSLYYKMDVMEMMCEMNLTGDAFLLPTDWQDQYYVESSRVPWRAASLLKGSLDEQHHERSESPRIIDERLAMELRNRLFFIPRAQRTYQDSEDSPEETSENEINGGCVSPISPRAAVTYAHRRNKKLRVYNERVNLEENVRSVVEIRQCCNPTIRHTMKVIVVDSHHDFVILYSMVDRDIFDDYPFISRSPRNFEWFFRFGLSYENQGGQQVAHRSGRICSDMVDYRGQMLASSSIDGGDSGGPCYAEDRSLIGIMVSSTTTDPLLGHENDRETMEDELRDASCSPADTWITPGNLIIEAFKLWQLQKGIIKVRRERERDDPEAKRKTIGTP